MRVHLDDIEPTAVTHDPHLYKRVLLKDTDTCSNLKMLNHACMAPREAFRAHSHSTMEEVFYFLEGQGRFTLAHESFEVRAGDCILVSPATPHACTNTGEGVLTFLAFGVALP